MTLGANASCHHQPLCRGARRSRSSLPGKSRSAALANCCPSVPFPARCFSGACSSKFSLYNSAAPSHREQLAAKRYRNVDLKPRKPIPSKHAAQLTARDVFLHYMSWFKLSPNPFLLEFLPHLLKQNTTEGEGGGIKNYSSKEKCTAKRDHMEISLTACETGR